jgi:hypothetical protein
MRSLLKLAAKRSTECLIDHVGKESICGNVRACGKSLELP